MKIIFSKTTTLPVNLTGALSNVSWRPTHVRMAVLLSKQAKSATSATFKTVQMMENNASYRKPKGTFRTKKVAKNLIFFLENYTIKPIQRTLGRFQVTYTHALETIL